MNSQPQTWSFGASATSTNMSHFTRVENNNLAEKPKQRNITDFFQVRRLPQQQQQKYQGQKPVQDDDRTLFFPVTDISTEDLLSEGRANVLVNDKEVALIYHNNEIFAVQGKCPHAGGPLHLGDIEDVPGCSPRIKCPWHKWTFDLKSGQCIFPRDRDTGDRVETFPVQLGSNGSVIKVGFNAISPMVFVTPPE